ncbi:MAG TPA: hypothetical protein VEC12_10340 [Bacteroidia bacterium]|nr:hypothetical protein [Bacteroidia bacterium]
MEEYHLGCIVALKSHFFNSGDQSNVVLLSGEPQLMPPLMVVTEKLKVTKKSFEENSGLETSVIGEFQYKCLWFSNKSFQFEDAWFLQDF